MILNKKLIDRCLAEVRKKGRKLDYYLLKNLFDNLEKNVIEELKRYQNKDGGFGKALEPDVRLPGSSVVCTDEAVLILDEIKDYSLKQELIKDIVAYYESSYKPEINGWELVPPEVDNYPRAVWWNYEGVTGFTYGNPNPQVVGFLAKNKEYLQKLDIRVLVERIVEYIINELPTEAGKHNIVSCLIFYSYIDDETKELIYPSLKELVDLHLERENWEGYCFEPIDVLVANKSFLDLEDKAVKANLDYHLKQLEEGMIMPNWEWGQFPEVFENAKFEWAGLLTYRIIKSLVS